MQIRYAVRHFKVHTLQMHVKALEVKPAICITS